MTKNKWLNYWIAKPMENVHLGMGVLLILGYILGRLLPNPALQALGTYGVMALLLVHLLHLQLHCLDRYLTLHAEKEYLPKRQMMFVNGLYLGLFLAVFLAAAWAGMVLCDKLYPARWFAMLKEWLIALLRFLFQPGAPAADAAVMETSFDLSVLTGAEEAGEPFWLWKWLDALVLVIGAVLCALLVGWGLVRVYLWICRKLSEWMGGKDEVTFLAPVVTDGAVGRQQKRAGRGLFPEWSVNGRVRKVYRQAVLKAAGKEMTIADHWSPEEIETQVGLRCEESEFRRIYEKARYSGRECDQEELRGMKKYLKK